MSMKGGSVARLAACQDRGLTSDFMRPPLENGHESLLRRIKKEWALPRPRRGRSSIAFERVSRSRKCACRTNSKLFAATTGRARPRSTTLRNAGAQFDRFDCSHAGVLGMANFTAAQLASLERASEARKPYVERALERREALFRALDAKREGKITKGAYLAMARQHFADIDVKQAGKITPPTSASRITAAKQAAPRRRLVWRRGRCRFAVSRIAGEQRAAGASACAAQLGLVAYCHVATRSSLAVSLYPAD